MTGRLPGLLARPVPAPLAKLQALPALGGAA